MYAEHCKWVDIDTPSELKTAIELQKKDELKLKNIIINILTKLNYV